MGEGQCSFRVWRPRTPEPEAAFLIPLDFLGGLLLLSLDFSLAEIQSRSSERQGWLFFQCCHGHGTGRWTARCHASRSAVSLNGRFLHVLRCIVTVTRGLRI